MISFNASILETLLSKVSRDILEVNFSFTFFTVFIAPTGSCPNFILSNFSKISCSLSRIILIWFLRFPILSRVTYLLIPFCSPASVRLPSVFFSGPEKVSTSSFPISLPFSFSLSACSLHILLASLYLSNSPSLFNR